MPRPRKSTTLADALAKPRHNRNAKRLVCRQCCFFSNETCTISAKRSAPDAPACNYGERTIKHYSHSKGKTK